MKRSSLTFFAEEWRGRHWYIYKDLVCKDKGAVFGGEGQGCRSNRPKARMVFGKPPLLSFLQPLDFLQKSKGREEGERERERESTRGLKGNK